MKNKKEKKFMSFVKKNKKLIIVIVVVLVLLSALSATIGIIISTPNGEKSSKKTDVIKVNKGKVKIVKNEASTIKYEDFDNGLVSLKIPKGWKVDTPNVGYVHYSIKVYNPKDPTYMFLFGMKVEGFLKSELARSTYAKYYPATPFAELAAVDPANAEGYFKVFNQNAKYSNTKEIGYNYFPYLTNYELIQNLGKTPLGGDLLRAKFTSDNNKQAEGLFTIDIKSVGTYYINTDIMNIFSDKVDVSPLIGYSLIMMTAPVEEFSNWESILTNCLNSLSFSQKFVDSFNAEEKSIMATFQANQKVYNEISDMIMSSWESRNNTYDIISQKQSDATLGYERVVDTDTGEIYKAYNGFMDDYNGTRFEAITDNMYTSPTSGYIEKN